MELVIPRLSAYISSLKLFLFLYYTLVIMELICTNTLLYIETYKILKSIHVVKKLDYSVARNRKCIPRSP